MQKINCGVYTITNPITNKVYVGKTNNLKNRWNTHKRLLKNNKHHCKQLQQEYNQLQHKDSLIFEIVVYNKCSRYLEIKIMNKFSHCLYNSDLQGVYKPSIEVIEFRKTVEKICNTKLQCDE